MIFETIVGIGIVTFLFFYLGFNLDNDHIFLKLVVIGMGVVMLAFIPFVLSTNNDFCDIKVSFTNETSPGAGEVDVVYNYERVCFTNDNETNSIFYRYILWFVRIFFAYILIYGIYFIATKSKENLINRRK